VLVSVPIVDMMPSPAMLTKRFITLWAMYQFFLWMETTTFATFEKIREIFFSNFFQRIEYFIFHQNLLLQRAAQRLFLAVRAWRLCRLGQAFTAKHPLRNFVGSLLNFDGFVQADQFIVPAQITFDRHTIMRPFITATKTFI
jgi:hypothetical protein